MESVDNDTLRQIYQIVKLLGIAWYSMTFHGPDMHRCYRNDLQKLCIVLFCPVWTNSHCINGWPMWSMWSMCILAVLLELGKMGCLHWVYIRQVHSWHLVVQFWPGNSGILKCDVRQKWRSGALRQGDTWGKNIWVSRFGFASALSLRKSNNRRQLKHSMITLILVRS